MVMGQPDLTWPVAKGARFDLVQYYIYQSASR